MRSGHCSACMRLHARPCGGVRHAGERGVVSRSLVVVHFALTAPRGTPSLVGLAACSVGAIASTPLAVLLAPLWLLRSFDGIGVCGDRREVVFGVTLLGAFGFVLTTPRLGAEGPLAVSVPGYDAPLVVGFRWASLEIMTARILTTLVVPQAMLNQLAISGSIPASRCRPRPRASAGSAAVEGHRRLVQSLLAASPS